MVSQYIFYTGCMAASIGLFWLLIATIRQGVWWAAALTAFAVSPGIILVLGGTFEQRSVWGLLDFDRQSWAVLIGDTFMLPLAAAMAALAWKRQQTIFTRWQLSLGRGLLFFIVGIVAGFTFHTWDSIINYIPAGAGDVVDSPTKVWHDLVAYPVLFGALLYGGIPVVFRRRATWHRWVIVACSVVWLAMVIRDTFWGRLDPNWLHPAWDAVNFRLR